MSVAQKLYEGIDIGHDGPTGLITYMRTDSTRVSKDALKRVREFISAAFGNDYLPATPNRYGASKRAQDAHEAIRPTYMTLPPEKIKRQLTPQQLKLYSLIWNRFVASQMKPATYDVVTVDVQAGRFLFRATAQNLKFEGFLKVYREAREPDDSANGENGVDALPLLKEREPLKLIELKPTQSFTKPPARFSEAMLVKQLEADGIGRPSTYATIISTLKDRKYVDADNKKLVPTELGTTVNRILVEYLPRLFNVAFTANMEKELDLVEDGSKEWVNVLRSFYGPFKDTIEGLKKKENTIKQSMVEKTDMKCDKCGAPMVIKWGRNGRFLACSAYPECKNAKPLPGEERQSQTDEKCEKCGSPMVIKNGRFGRFMACSAYPKCKNTKPITLGISCPREGCGGELMEKQTRGRKIFYGCSRYPKCDYATWDKPVKLSCPVCRHPIMLQKTSKKRGEFLRCPECRHEAPLPTSDTDESSVASTPATEPNSA